MTGRRGGQWMAWVIFAVVFCSAFILSGAVEAADKPLVGLAGDNYRLAYIDIIEKLGGESEQISGAELEAPEVLARYDAVIIVTKGDPGQKEFGLTAKASKAVTAFVENGGRALCEYGCNAPTEIIENNWGAPGFGTHWVVTSNEHPITAGMRIGQAVRYGQYGFRMRDVEGPITVLMREESGGPAVTSISYGDGEIIQTCGDLAAGNRDGTTDELGTRVVLYLLYGRAQERFGPALPEATATTTSDEYVTTRELAADVDASAGEMLRNDFDGAPVAAAGETSGLTGAGYAVEGREGVWRIGASEGDGRFAPFTYLPLGEAEVVAGSTYRASVRVKLSGLHASVPSSVQVRLRYYAEDGQEIPLDTMSSAEPEVIGDWEELSVQTEAPKGTVRAGLELVVMLPGGEVEIDEFTFGRALTAEEVFAAETPIGGKTMAHPRAITSPEQAAGFAQAVQDTDRGVYGVSRAEMFAAVKKRADDYLKEDVITFGDKTMPWPPNEIPDFGGGLAWNPLAGAIQDRLQNLSVAYIGTGDARYGERAKELLLGICNWPQWSDPNNNYIALEIGNISLGAVFAYDLCYDILTDDERAFAQKALRRNTLLPLHKQLTANMHDSNGYALWSAAMGLCSIATLGEVEGTSTCLRLAEDRMLWYFDARTNKHRTEGQGYDSWAYGLLINLAESIRRNTGVDHLDHPILPVLPRFAVGFLANDRQYHAWFSDAGGTVDYIPWHYPMVLLSAYNGDALAGWYLKETQAASKRDYDVFKLLAYAPQMPALGEAPKETGAIFPRAGWASLRSDWGPDGTMVAVQCSSSGQGHQHMDQGNFLIYRGTENLVMDCGYASALGSTLREFARGSVGHNCILVDGKGQSYKRGSTPYFATSTHVDYVMADATAAYGTSLVTRVQRHFVYIKPDILLIVDQLRAAEQPRRFSWLLHPDSYAPKGLATVTLNGTAMEVNGKARQGRIEIIKGEETMRILPMRNELGVRYVTYPGAEKYNPYIEVTSQPLTELVLPMLMTFGDTHINNGGLNVHEGTVLFRGQANGKIYDVTLKLAGENGESPTLKVTADGETLIDKDDLSVPEDIQG